MKFIVIVALLFISTTSFAGECEKPTAREAVLCLEQQIIYLNTKIQQLEKAIASVSNLNLTPLASIENNGLRTAIQSLSLNNKGELSITAMVTNVGKNEVGLALIGAPPVASDNLGNIYEYKQLSGVTACSTLKEYDIKHCLSTKDSVSVRLQLSQYTRLSPNGSINIVFVFKNENSKQNKQMAFPEFATEADLSKPVSPSVFNFAANFAMLIIRNASSYSTTTTSISFANIIYPN